jgi:hypothetical protein
LRPLERHAKSHHRDAADAVPLSPDICRGFLIRVGVADCWRIFSLSVNADAFPIDDDADPQPFRERGKESFAVAVLRGP